MEYSISNIVADIISDKCVLFLGPELLINSDGKYYKAFFKELADRGKESYRYHSKDNLFSIFGGSEVNVSYLTLRNKVCDYYARSGDYLLLDTISRIPFSLIVNVSPDTSVNQMFTDNKFAFNKSYFKDPKGENLPTPSSTLPEIFNIFGTIENRQSVILTHSDLFKAIKDLQTINIPSRIRSHLENADSLIFLGMKFDTWYYQLLLNMLGIDQRISARICGSQEMDDDTVSVIADHFQINFSENNPAKLVENIYNELKSEFPGSLRVPIQNSIKPKKAVYVSYAWKDNADPNREFFVDKTVEELKKIYQADVYRDKNILTIRDSIESFMNRIGKGKAVLVVVSDKYLKSEFCMYEAWQLYKNDNLLKRVFLVELPDIKRDATNQIDTAHYIEYWASRKKIKESDARTRFSSDSVAAIKFIENTKTINYIYLFISEFLSKIIDTIHFTAADAISWKESDEAKYREFIDVEIKAILNE